MNYNNNSIILLKPINTLDSTRTNVFVIGEANRDHSSWQLGRYIMNLPIIGRSFLKLEEAHNCITPMHIHLVSSYFPSLYNSCFWHYLDTYTLASSHLHGRLINIPARCDRLWRGDLHVFIWTYNANKENIYILTPYASDMPRPPIDWLSLTSSLLRYLLPWKWDVWLAWEMDFIQGCLGPKPAILIMSKIVSKIPVPNIMYTINTYCRPLLEWNSPPPSIVAGEPSLHGFKRRVAAHLRSTI